MGRYIDDEGTSRWKATCMHAAGVGGGVLLSGRLHPALHPHRLL